MRDKLKKIMDEDLHLVERILNSFKFKTLEKLKSEKEPPMAPQESFAEILKLKKQNRNRNQSTNAKQTFNQTSSISKSRK